MNKLKQIIDMLQDEKIIEEIIGFIQWAVDRGSITEKQRVKSNLWVAWLKKQGEKVDAIENFDTEFEKQVSHLIASIINKEHEYNEGFVKWAANALLNYAKHELEKQGEQKTAWSEEDEKLIEEVADSLHKYSNYVQDGNSKVYILSLADSIKSLQPRCTSLTNDEPKQEWSEEDKGNLLDVKCIIDEVWHNQDVREEIDHSSEELESLWHWLDNVWQKVEYPQNTWKPSDAHMQALEKVRVILHNPSIWDESNPILYQYEELMRDLIKLREE